MIMVGNSIPHNWVKCYSHTMNTFLIQHILPVKYTLQTSQFFNVFFSCQAPVTKVILALSELT